MLRFDRKQQNSVKQLPFNKKNNKFLKNKLQKIFKEMGASDHFTCFLRNLYSGQEITVRSGHGKVNWFKFGDGVRQGCISSPCLFNLVAEYIIQNPGFHESEAEIKTAG